MMRLTPEKAYLFRRYIMKKPAQAGFFHVLREVDHLPGPSWRRSQELALYTVRPFFRA